jgi:hypothetical protein
MITVLAFAAVGCGDCPEQSAEMAAPGFPPLTGAFLGQSPPGADPEVFAPGVISTGMSELNSVFTPDGKEFYYAVDIGLDWVIMVSREVDGGWTEPVSALFTRGHSGVDLCVSKDNQRLFYCSNRSRTGGVTPEDNVDIWYVDRLADGTWSEPTNLAVVNSDTHEFYPTLTDDGTLYFLSGREGGVGGSDIYRSTLVDGQYQDPVNLGPVINSAGNEGDAFVSPDESFLIFVSRGHPAGPDGGSLFISFRGADDSWSTPRALGSVMKADRSDFCPMLSPDGRFLFFSSARPRLEDESGLVSWSTLQEAQSRPGNGNTDIYWVDAGILDALKP